MSRCARERLLSLVFFFFNDTATTEIYTLSLHDALPICELARLKAERVAAPRILHHHDALEARLRSEEHTSELQSRFDLVCRLLLEKKKIRSRSPGSAESAIAPVHG